MPTSTPVLAPGPTTTSRELEWAGDAVESGVGRAADRCASVFNLDSLCAAFEGTAEVVWQRPIGRNFIAFNDDVAHGGEAFGEVGRFKMWLNADTSTVENTDSWGINGLLDVHATIDEVKKDLQLALGLHVPAHAAEAEA